MNQGLLKQFYDYFHKFKLPTAMLGHTLIFRTSALINGNSKLFAFTNRISQVNDKVPCMGLKNKAKDVLDNYKIPEKPKRPLTAYFKFMLEKKPALLKENPALQQKEAVRVLSEQWKVMSAAAKAKYEEAAIHDKEKYDEEILDYNAQLTPEQEAVLHKMAVDKRQDRKKRRIKKEIKTLGKPKRPITSFGLFVQTNSVSGQSFTELIQDLKSKWAQLPEAEKQNYQLIYRRNKEAYEVELAKWESQMIAEGKSHLVRVQTLKKSFPGQEKKGPHN